MGKTAVCVLWPVLPEVDRTAWTGPNRGVVYDRTIKPAFPAPPDPEVLPAAPPPEP